MTIPERVTPTNAFKQIQEKLYLSDAQMPFHGISHPSEIQANADLLIERCRSARIPVDEESLRKAIILHDALLHIDAMLLDFRSAESLAGRLAYNFTIAQGGSVAEATKIERIILATNALIRPYAIEEILIRAADLGNLAQNYEQFSQKTLQLYREHELLRGPMGLGEWTARSFHFLRYYLWPLLELTPQARDRHGRSVWHMQVLKNMIRFWRENCASDGLVEAQLGASLDLPFSPSSRSPRFFIAIEHREPLREQFVHSVSNMRPGGCIAIAIPGTEGAFSLPDGCCDRLVVQELSSTVIAEASRILKAEGELCFSVPAGHVQAPPHSGALPPGFVFDRFEKRADSLAVCLVKN